MTKILSGVSQKFPAMTNKIPSKIMRFKAPAETVVVTTCPERDDSQDPVINFYSINMLADRIMDFDE